MNKKILTKANFGDAWIIRYDDLSIDVKCTSCGKVEELAPDTKWAQNLNQIEEAYKTYKCLDCWKKGRQAEKDEREEEYQARIRLGQAVNLARQDLSDMKSRLSEDGVDNIDIERFMDGSVEFWLKYLAHAQEKFNNN